MEHPKIEGYKAFHYTLKRGLYCNPRANKLKTFKVGEIATQRGKIKLCKNGIHFCEKINSVFFFYDNRNSFYARVTAIGKTKSDGIKSVTSKLLINELVSMIDIFKLKDKKISQTGKKRFYFNQIEKKVFDKAFRHINFYFEDADVYKYFLEQKSKTNRITLSYYIYNYNTIILTNKKIKDVK